MKLFLAQLFLFLLFTLSLFSSGVMDSQDALQYLSVAKNIYYGKGPTAPVYEYDKEKNIHMSTFVGKDGRTYSPTGLGYSLALVPSVALTDVFYKFFSVVPSEHFPLEADWLILLNASFINSFFGAALGVILYIYFRKIKLTHKQALIMILLSIFATSLFTFSKHTFAHMMFTVFFMLSLLLLKIYIETRKGRFMVISGISYGVMAITYNQTFILTTLPFILFYLIESDFRFNRTTIFKVLKDFGLFFAGVLPFLVIYYWYESIRASADQDLTQAAFFTSYAGYKLVNLPASAIIEGMYGQFFSPGRSIFLYSPLLIIIPLFWFKIKKIVRSELFTLLLLTLIYTLFYSMQFTYGGLTEGYAMLWAGESSWGPRYLVPLLPLAMIIIAHIYSQLSKKAILFLVMPLALAGFYVQFLGILMPYQIKYHNLERHFYVNSTEFTNYTYSNLIPRFSPIFMMSKKLVKNLVAFPKTLDHGPYNVKFFDGIDFPFNVGPERWRVIENEGYISFDNQEKNPVKNLSFGMINHPLKVARDSARINFILNGQKLNSNSEVLRITERKTIKLSVSKDILKPQGNILEIKPEFVKSGILQKRQQLLGIISFEINGKAVNMESLDFPYYSNLGPAMVGAQYLNYGAKITDPWRFWEIHTQIYERTPDFWWMRALYYWDYPKAAILSLFSLILILAVFFGIKVFTGHKV